MRRSCFRAARATPAPAPPPGGECAPPWGRDRAHWDELLPRFAASNVIHLAVGARTFTDPELVAEVQAFFADHDIPQNHLSLVQAMERQRMMAAMRERASGELAARFSEPA